MLTVGLTGGYASGKSFVARELEQLGCHIIYADELGHRVLFADGEAYRPVLEAFGTGILASDGSIDRKKLGAIVFKSPDLLRKLSAFVHPAVFRLEQETMRSVAATDPNGITVIEAAILIETGRYRAFDRLILTACSVETQIARGMKRDHLTRQQVQARLDKQMSLDEKQRYADYVVDTDRSKQETAAEIARIYSELAQLAEHYLP